MLYGILLDRMSLSAKNGWIDKNGRVYIIFTIDEAKMALNCAEQKAIKLLSELEKKAGLIERKRQGFSPLSTRRIWWLPFQREQQMFMPVL